jgi:acetyl-CoA C-acetyltransferase
LQTVYILSAVRTPIGKFGGSLASLTAADMGVVAAKAAMGRARIQPEHVEETIFGNARQATKRGVATLCVSRGLGMALALENVV